MSDLWRPDDWNTTYYAAFVKEFPVKARTTAEAARDWQCFEAGADAILAAVADAILDDCAADTVSWECRVGVSTWLRILAQEQPKEEGRCKKN